MFLGTNEMNTDKNIERPMNINKNQLDENQFTTGTTRNQPIKTMGLIRPSIDHPSYLIGRTFKNRWRVGRFIHKGVHSDVHECYDLVTKSNVSIKVESNRSVFKSLSREIDFYKAVHQNCNDSFKLNIPQMFDHGNEMDFTFLVMQRLGKSIADIKKSAGGALQINSLMYIAFNLLHVIESLHSIGYLHGNISASKVVMGAGQDRGVYLVDFGCHEDFQRNGQNYKRINPTRTMACDLKDLAKLILSLAPKRRVPWFRRILCCGKGIDHENKDGAAFCKSALRTLNIDTNALNYLQSFWDHCMQCAKCAKTIPDYNFLLGVLQSIHWAVNGKSINFDEGMDFRSLQPKKKNYIGSTLTNVLMKSVVKLDIDP